MTAEPIGTPPPGEPVDVTLPYGEPINRLWGIPLLGFLVRAIILLPSLIGLWVLSIVLGLTVLVSWIPVLVNGRQAGWVTSIVGGYLRWLVRLGAYFLLVTNVYPPFSLSAGTSTSVRIDSGQQINRLWGIPFVGIWVRLILCIPHFIVLFFLAIPVVILTYFCWLPVLLLGRQAGPYIGLLGGYWRWYTRVAAYLWLLTDRYPPFRLGS